MSLIGLCCLTLVVWTVIVTAYPAPGSVQCHQTAKSLENTIHRNVSNYSGVFVKNIRIAEKMNA